ISREALMHRATIAGLLLCCRAASFWACASDKSPPTAQSFPPATPGVRMSIAAPTCEPKTHPNGVIDTITTPPSFGIAVREDGLAYFTEFQNGRSEEHTSELSHGSSSYA